MHFGKKKNVPLSRTTQPVSQHHSDFKYRIPLFLCMYHIKSVPCEPHIICQSDDGFSPVYSALPLAPLMSAHTRPSCQCAEAPAPRGSRARRVRGAGGATTRCQLWGLYGRRHHGVAYRGSHEIPTDPRGKNLGKFRDRQGRGPGLPAPPPNL